MYLKNGVWTKGPSPRSGKGPKVISHRSQKTAVVPSGRRLDFLIKGEARLCVKRCLAPDTRILLGDGLLKPISEVKVGDTVVNGRGELTTVVQKTCSGQPDFLVKFRSNRMLFPITATPEHQVLVLDLRGKCQGNHRGISYFARKLYARDLVRWLPASELTEETFLLTPSRVTLNLKSEKSIDLGNYLQPNHDSKITDEHIVSVGKCHPDTAKKIAQELNVSVHQVNDVSSGKSKCTKAIHCVIQERLKERDQYTYTKRFIPIGYDLGKFLGIFLGDGSRRLRISKGHVNSGEISIAVNSAYRDQVDEIQRIVRSLFGLECSSYMNKKRGSHCVQLVFYSIPIAKMLQAFGIRDTKQLPGGFLFESPEYLRGLLDGLLQSDGHVRGRSESFENTSPFLVSLVYWLQSRFGRNPKVSMDTRQTAVFHYNHYICKRLPSLKVWTLTHQNAGQHQRITSDGVLYDIGTLCQKELLPNDQGIEVWDIGVSSTESFVAENTVVHNSLGGLGDIIMATPIARGAKIKYPKCHVTYAVPVDYAGGDLVGLLEHNPFIDEIIDYRLVERDDYDAFADITRVGLSEERPHTLPANRIDLFAQAAGVPLFGNFQPIYTILQEEDEWGKNFVQKEIGNLPVKGKIAIHLRSNDPKRTWPKHRVREFLSLAAQEGYFCFLFGWGDSRDDWQLKRTSLVFDFRGRQAHAILNNCDVLVCPDSYMLHLAGALGMRTVSLFGNMPPSCRINHYPNAVAVVNQQISCLGCIYAACPNNFYCMSSITPEMVLNAVRMKLREGLIEGQTSLEEDQTVYSEPIPREIGTVAL